TPDTFWQNVRTNLQAGRIRLIFVADEIPTELLRVVEFLNSQMTPAEVLAVEIRQYVGSGLRTLVPRLLGQTTQKLSARETRQWDEASFFEDLGTRHGAEVVRVARSMVDWAKTRNLRLWWGKGRRDGSCFPMCDFQGEAHHTIAVWTYG